MHKLKWMQKCALVNFCNWMVTPKIWIIIGVMAIFSIWNISQVLDYSSEVGIRVTPWIFPHYFSMPAMFLVYGFLTIALFSDAPFRSLSSQFIEIRTGKRLWIQGQCLFIAEASFCYAFAYLLMSVVMVLPRIYFTTQWGKLIEKMAYNAFNGFSGLSFSSQLIEEYQPMQAMAWTFLFIWLVSCFLGMLILASRIVIGDNAGNVIAGFIVFLSYFSMYIGPMLFGDKIFRFCPVNWIYIGTLGTGASNLPDKFYAFSFLAIGIILSGAFGIKVYEARELEL